MGEIREKVFVLYWVRCVYVEERRRLSEPGSVPSWCINSNQSKNSANYLSLTRLRYLVRVTSISLYILIYYFKYELVGNIRIEGCGYIKSEVAKPHTVEGRRS